MALVFQNSISQNTKYAIKGSIHRERTNYDEFDPGLLIDVFIIDCKSRLAVVVTWPKKQ